MIIKFTTSKDRNEISSSPEESRPFTIKLEPSTKRQIVQSADSDDTSVKDDAYLSDKNRSFERQSRAIKVGIYNEGNKGAAGGSPKPKHKELSLSDLGAQVRQDPFKEAAKELRQNPGKGGVGERRISSTNDYLENVPLGDTTYLNTAEFKFYGFYHRIKQKLEQFWGRSIQNKAEQLAKSGRTVASDSEMITSLQITLNHKGEIVDIKVRGTSGVRELDDAAIEAFNDAGPFPNPPKGMIVDGKVTLEWGFVVKS